MPLNPAVPVYGKTTTGANEAIGCTTPTAATQTLTFSGNAVAGETFKIGVNTYVWTSTAANISGQTPYFVLIGADAAASIVNATAAITGTTSKGTLFSNNTNPNPVVTAVATSSTVLTITATAPGADGNGIALSETMTNAAWGATTTTGGISASLNVTVSSGSITILPSVGAPTTLAPVASSTTTIPSGAFNIGIMLLTGTGTIGGVSWPLLTPYNVTDKISTTLVLVLGNPGTAVVNYLS